MLTIDSKNIEQINLKRIDDVLRRIVHNFVMGIGEDGYSDKTFELSPEEVEAIIELRDNLTGE